MSKENICSSTLLMTDVDKLTYRQLQLELKSRHLKAAGKTTVLRERLRQSLIDEENEDERILEDLDECSICLDKLSSDQRTTIETTCYHRYHRFCLKKWIESNNDCSMSCPLCRCSLANERSNEQDLEKKNDV